MIVVDSNVIGCLCLPGDQTAKAESVCRVVPPAEPHLGRGN